MPQKELICQCGVKSRAYYKKGALIVYCEHCGVGHPLAFPPFQGKTCLTEEGKVTASEDIPKGDLIEKCPLLPMPTSPLEIRNSLGEKVVPLGLLLRYGTSEQGNVVLKVKQKFIFVYALANIMKHEPLTLKEKK